VRGGLFGGGRFHEGYKNTASLQHFPRTILRFAANGVQHDIDVARHFFKFRFAIIDDFVGAELADLFGVSTGRGAEHSRSFRFCELHREAADASRCAVNQNRLTWS
jgi:hypothetical protein